MDNFNLVISSYPNPEKEIEERIKLVKRTLGILERELGYKPPEDTENIEEFVKKAYEFLLDSKKRMT